MDQFETGCTRGKWRFCMDLSKEFAEELRTDSFRFRNKPYNVTSPFWADKNDGARVFRSNVGQTGRLLVFYTTKDFCIGFSTIITNTDNVEGMRLIEAGEMATLDYAPIFSESDETWVNKMSARQYESFLKDVCDLNLYACLFDCIPKDWQQRSSPYRGWGTRLYKPIERLSFSRPGVSEYGYAGAQGCFSFLASMIKFKAWWPKDSDAPRTYKQYQDLLDGLDPTKPQ